jgi:hypothetical protein
MVSDYVMGLTDEDLDQIDQYGPQQPDDVSLMVAEIRRLRSEASAYDSIADTLGHARRVAELMAPVVGELAQRAAVHDASKLEDPEKSAFDAVTPRLAVTQYVTEAYRDGLGELGPALAHHYANNRHHPENRQHGVTTMTLVDLIEMLADWRAATERHEYGSMVYSLRNNAARFNIPDPLMRVLWETARAQGWLDRDECGMPWTAPDGTREACNEPYGHEGLHADGNWDGGMVTWNDDGKLDGGWTYAGTLPAGN